MSKFGALDKLLAARNARRMASVEQKPASTGEQIDAARWSKKEADPTAEAVLKDWLAENGLEGGVRPKPVEYAHEHLLKPGTDANRYYDAVHDNSITRHLKAPPDQLPYEQPFAFSSSEHGSQELRKLGKALDSGFEQSYWKQVEDPDFLPMSVGSPLASSMNSSPVKGKIRSENPVINKLQAGADWIDSKLPEPNLDEENIFNKISDYASKAPAGAAMGFQSTEERKARKESGVGPVRELVDSATDPKSLALMALMRKVK